jgi:tRNA modification GTPase
MDTFVAQATPVGTSAIALIRVNGPLVEAIVSSLQSKTGSPAKTRHAYFGNYNDIAGSTIDTVVWTYFGDGASYTGDAILEIMPHGNPYICKKIIEDLCRRGCRLAEPGEFTQRAFLNKKLNFSQVEGVLETIHAQTDRALFQARKQLSGESGNIIKGIVRELTNIRAEVEAHIDFPEDELPQENINQIEDALIHLTHRLQAFESTAQTKELIQNGIHTLIVGAPNAGKSSLLNFIVGHSRALVSAVSGTTRDYILERAYIGDYLLNLYDTAGITESPSNEIESLGIKRTLELIEQTDLFLLVIDRSQPAPHLPPQLLEHLAPDNTLVVENKADLADPIDHSSFLPQLQHIAVSTLCRNDYPKLSQSLVSLFRESLMHEHEYDTMFNHRQAAFIQQARMELEDGLLNIRKKLRFGDRRISPDSRI